ncbi:hypothetical protein NOCARDAX2BIS_90036 [Nocardioides sp. AX2bis]|nr:hypothetical protein NOCARDAX2BIS_90036 [Nocardioides sp. AX2bis]
MVGAAGLPAGGAGPGRRERRPRAHGRPPHRRRVGQPAHRPRAAGRRAGHHAGRGRRRVGHHDVRREHRRDGGDARLLDRGLLGRGCDGAAAELLAEVRCAGQHDPGGCPGRGDRRAVRPDRRHRRQDLDRQPGRLLPSGQPAHRRRRPRDRDRRPDPGLRPRRRGRRGHRDRAGHRFRAGRLPPDDRGGAGPGDRGLPARSPRVTGPLTFRSRGPAGRPGSVYCRVVRKRRVVEGSEPWR